jgi:hypothetical protein
MTKELRIRVKVHVKDLLEYNKERFGASINFQVNFAIYKYLILDTKAKPWEKEFGGRETFRAYFRVCEKIKRITI